MVFHENAPETSCTQASVLRIESRPPLLSSSAFPPPSAVQNHAFITHTFALPDRPLAPYVSPGTLTPITLALHRALLTSATSHPSRPTHRQSAASKFPPSSPSSSSSFSSALLLQVDHARFFTSPTTSTLCVELKPKATLTSISCLVSPAICTALQKFVEPPHKFKYPYSPSDIVSGDVTRIARALDTLRTQRAHSLRVFKDGHVALADDLPLAPPIVSRDAAYGAAENRAAIAAAAQILAQETGVIAGLRVSQRRDYVDALGAERVFNHLVEACCGGDAARAEAAVWCAYFNDDGGEEGRKFEEEVAATRAALSYPDSRTARQLHCTERYQDACRVVCEMPAMVAARVVADFMVASVVKDCSIMVSMSRVQENSPLVHEHNVTLMPDGTRWVYNVSVVDLEPKPLAKLAGWAARDRAALSKRAAGPLGSIRTAALIALDDLETERSEKMRRGTRGRVAHTHEVLGSLQRLKEEERPMIDTCRV